MLFAIFPELLEELRDIEPGSASWLPPRRRNPHGWLEPDERLDHHVSVELRCSGVLLGALMALCRPFSASDVPKTAAGENGTGFGTTRFVFSAGIRDPMQPPNRAAMPRFRLLIPLLALLIVLVLPGAMVFTDFRGACSDCVDCT